MQVRGFNVTLFAGEPAITQPIGFCLDDRGRLWVAEAKNYQTKAGLNDRIIILEDTDGDGRHDKRIVFYDKLEYVSGIEVGFGGVGDVVAEFLFYPDEDYDVQTASRRCCSMASALMPTRTTSPTVSRGGRTVGCTPHTGAPTGHWWANRAPQG